MALSNNMKGAVLMALSMAGFTCNDALVKAVTPFVNVGQIMFVRGALTTLLVYVIARQMGALRHIRILKDPMILLRIGFEILAAITYLSALGNIPLANASSILQSLPLAVTLGAALVLKEPVGWRRWTAILVGFLGVMIIIRPGPEGFTLAALYVVISVFAAASRDLATKKIGASTPSLTVTLFTAIGNGIVGAVLIVPMGGWQPMSGSTFGLLALASLLVFVGYQSIVMAMRMGEISFIAPFRYTSLLWALGLGIVFFGETPDFWMIFGATVVICSGLYTFYRENKRQLADPVGQESRPGSPV